MSQQGPTGPIPINRDTLQRVIDYMVTQPYKDVASLLADVSQAVAAANEKAAPAAKTNGKNRVKELAK